MRPWDFYAWMNANLLYIFVNNLSDNTDMSFSFYILSVFLYDIIW
jgi:hypothetical protein